MIMLRKHEKHGVVERLTVGFMVSRVYTVFFERFEKVTRFTDGWRLFQNTKFFFCSFLNELWGIFVASLPGCFGKYVIKMWKTR